MSYALQADIQALYGLELLYIVADRDRDQVLDTAAIASALELATSEINSKLSIRYPVPLPVVSDDIKRICIDIAVYRLALSADALTKEIERRYEIAREDLMAMAKGTIGIGIPSADPKPAAGSDLIGGEIMVSGNDRLMTRQQLRGL